MVLVAHPGSLSMDSSRLTSDQLDARSGKVAPILAYLNALQERMERTGFPPDDELYLLVKQANDAVHRLRIDLHYRSCDARRR
jgi:hypothetical protein